MRRGGGALLCATLLCGVWRVAAQDYGGSDAGGSYDDASSDAGGSHNDASDAGYSDTGGSDYTDTDAGNPPPSTPAPVADGSLDSDASDLYDAGAWDGASSTLGAGGTVVGVVPRYGAYAPHRRPPQINVRAPTRTQTVVVPVPTPAAPVVQRRPSSPRRQAPAARVLSQAAPPPASAQSSDVARPYECPLIYLPAGRLSLDRSLSDLASACSDPEPDAFCDACVSATQSELALSLYAGVTANASLAPAVATIATDSAVQRDCGALIVTELRRRGVDVNDAWLRRVAGCATHTSRPECPFSPDELETRIVSILDACEDTGYVASDADGSNVTAADSAPFCQNCYWPLVKGILAADLSDAFWCHVKRLPLNASAAEEDAMWYQLVKEPNFVACAMNADAILLSRGQPDPLSDEATAPLRGHCWDEEVAPAARTLLDDDTRKRVEALRCDA